MSLKSGADTLAEVRMRLRVRRMELDRNWTDDVAKRFAAQVLDTLDRDLQRAIDAMSEIAPTVDRARRECE